MVRHYYMRHAPWQADIRINLAPKSARAQSSHQIALRIRPLVEALARKHGAKVKIVECRRAAGAGDGRRRDLRAARRRVLANSSPTEASFGASSSAPRAWSIPDDFAVAAQPRLQFVLDREKAALHGITTAEVAQTLSLMLGGEAVDTVHTDNRARSRC